MPSKLILNVRGMSGGHESHVHLQYEGEDPVELKRVKRAILTVDEDGPPMVELHVYSPDFDNEVLITDYTAEAIVMHERQQQLSFLTGADVAGLIALRHTLINVLEFPPDDDRLKPIQKIIAELEKREEIPF